jgi:hypothetical protein
MKTFEVQKQTPSGLWRTLRYDLTQHRDIARFVARGKYSWPGGYELFAVTDDGACLCADCCRSEYARIARSEPGDGWRVVAYDCEEAIEDLLLCDHCGRVIVDAEGAR